MTLTENQRKMIENNLGLVGKVIKDKVHGLTQASIYTYDDLFQIGCIGLCKAAATDKGGTFSTYAYRLIWNEICDALIRATRISGREEVMDPQSATAPLFTGHRDPYSDMDLRLVLEQVEGQADSTVASGIYALRLSLVGYNSQEIGRMLSAQPSAVRMRMTKARRYLREQLEHKTQIV